MIPKSRQQSIRFHTRYDNIDLQDQLQNLLFLSIICCMTTTVAASTVYHFHCHRVDFMRMRWSVRERKLSVEKKIAVSIFRFERRQRKLLHKGLSHKSCRLHDKPRKTHGADTKSWHDAVVRTAAYRVGFWCLETINWPARIVSNAI